MSDHHEAAMQRRLEKLNPAGWGVARALDWLRNESGEGGREMIARVIEAATSTGDNPDRFPDAYVAPGLLGLTHEFWDGTAAGESVGVDPADIHKLTLGDVVSGLMVRYGARAVAEETARAVRRDAVHGQTLSELEMAAKGWSPPASAPVVAEGLGIKVYGRLPDSGEALHVDMGKGSDEAVAE